MDRTEFRARIGQLMADGHALHSRINAAMTELGDARSAEWATLYNVMMTVGVANRIMYDSVQPGPSALVEADTLTDVPMVCTVCRQPVQESEDNAGNRMRLHDFPGDGAMCPRTYGPVKAMVAAGNENVPADV